MPPMAQRIREPSAQPRSLEHLGLGPFDLAAKARRALDAPCPGGWQPTGIDRGFYLSLAETVVRNAAAWQDARGAILDPVLGQEFAQTSPRFAAPGAVLLAFGRAGDLREAVFKAMDWSCRRLAERQAGSPDFWMRELATAFMCLEPLAEAPRAERWRHWLRAVEPEATYQQVRPDGTDLHMLHNWTVYAAAGEVIREAAGLCVEDRPFLCGQAFFGKYMPAQLTHFTAFGMYRDPGDPITYDITTRLQIATALAFGYDGPLRDDLDELLRRGGLTTLLTASPQGLAPYGGRSGQFHFQEAILCALCELEARRYRGADARLAGAFKRQARRSALAVRRWLLDMHPLRHIKNGFDPATSWGCDAYAKYSVYSLLAGSFLGLAAIFADDAIAEAPCPAETAGHVVVLDGAFHKVFASCGDSQVEVDMRADFAHESTGLGRFARDGVPIELGPGMPVTAGPSYTVPPEHRAESNAAVGSAWRIGGQWRRLADLSETLRPRVRVETQTSQEVAFTVEYLEQGTGVMVRERVRLTPGRVRLAAEVAPPAGQIVETVRMLVPLLVTDGDEESAITLSRGLAEVRYRGATLTVRFDPALPADLDERPVGNRNGLYRVLAISAEADRIGAELLLAPANPLGG